LYFACKLQAHCSSSERGQNSTIDITVFNVLDGSGLNLGRDRRFPDWLWGLPSLLFSGYQGSFLEYMARACS